MLTRPQRFGSADVIDPSRPGRFDSRYPGEAKSARADGESAFRWFQHVGTLSGVSSCAVSPPAMWLLAGWLGGVCRMEIEVGEDGRR